MTEKKGIIKQIGEVITPPKTEAQKREAELIKKWNLRKDLKVPNRYWINDQLTITFNPGDEESVAAAEAELAAFFRAPKIERVSSAASAAHSPYNKPGKKEGVMAQIVRALSDSGFTDLTERAKKGQKEMFAGDFGFDPEKASDTLMSTKGVPEFKSSSGAPERKKKKKNDEDFGLKINEGLDEDFFP